MSSLWAPCKAPQRNNNAAGCLARCPSRLVYVGCPKTFLCPIKKSPTCQIVLKMLSYRFHHFERFLHVFRPHFRCSAPDLDIEHCSTKANTKTRISYWSSFISQVHMFLREGKTEKMAPNVFGTCLRLTKAAMN